MLHFLAIVETVTGYKLLTLL